MNMQLHPAWQHALRVPPSVWLAVLLFLLASILPMLFIMDSLRLLDVAMAIGLTFVFSSTVLMRKPWGRFLIWALCLWQIGLHLYSGLHVEHWIEHVARLLDVAVVILLLLPSSSIWFHVWKTQPKRWS